MLRFSLLVLPLLLLFCSPMVSYAELGEAAMMTQAKSHYKEGGFYYSTVWLERILKNWPDTPQREEVLLMMAKAYVATDREEKATRTLKALLDEFPMAKSRLDRCVLDFMAKLDNSGSPYASKDPSLTALAAESSTSSSAPRSDRVDQASDVTAPAEVAPAMVGVAAPVAATGTGATPKEPLSATEGVTETASAPSVDTAQATAEAVPSGPRTGPQVTEPHAVAPKKADEPVADSAKVPAAAKVAGPVELPVAVQSAARPEAPAVQDAAPGACRDSLDDGSTGTYVLDLGEYVGRNRLARVNRMVKKAGLVPVVAEGPKKTEMMLRIQVGEFHDPQSTQNMVGRLREAKAQYFVLKDKQGTSRVYAGSYHDKASAGAARKRLAALGIQSQLKEVAVSVPTLSLSAGCFSSEASAREKMAELERLGVKGDVLLKR